MVKLFYCCLEVDNKTTYLTINIFDLIFAAMQMGYLAAFIKFNVFSPGFNYFIYGALALCALISLIFFV